MEKIFLLHAAARSGKNTCADAMKDYYVNSYHKRVLIIAFADYVKFVLDKYYDTPAERTEEYRTRIQQFATEQVRASDVNYWANVVSDLLVAIQEDWDIVIIPDWRFGNERVALVSRFYEYGIPVKTMLIDRPNIEEVDGMTEEQRAHSSERNLDNYQNFDYTIINETSQMQKTIQQLIDIIDKEEKEND